MVKSAIFREYDIRGVVGESLFAKDAVRIGAAYAQKLRAAFPAKKELWVNVGYDGRLSTPDMLQHLLQGLLSADFLRVRLIGLGPTPMLYFSVFHHNADGGIMITGSHNPKNHNGFKMMIGKSSLFGAEIQDLYKIAANIDAGAPQSQPVTEDIAALYIQRLLQGCAPGGKKRRIAWDAGNGAAGRILPDLIRALPGEHIVLNEKVDGNFPAHHPDPSVEENMIQLRDTVLKNKCDAGFAFDGDADRIGVVDDKGQVWWGDQILLFLAEDIARRHKGAPIIGDVKCSQVLFDEIEKMGAKPVMWKTGHSLVKSKMAELRAPLGGEMSGHIFIADEYYGYDDGIFAAIRFLRYLQDLPGTLSDWRARLPQIHNTPEMRIECAEDRKFQVIEEVRARLQKTGAKFIAIDGVRAVTDHGWWLLRASNTQPALALRAEAQSREELQKLQHEVESQLRQSGVELRLAGH